MSTIMPGPNSVKLNYHAVNDNKNNKKYGGDPVIPGVPNPDRLNYVGTGAQVIGVVVFLLWVALCVVFNIVAIGESAAFTTKDSAQGAIMTLGILGLISAVAAPYMSWIIGLVAFIWALVQKKARGE